MEIIINGVTLTPSAPKERQTLAFLLSRANRLVDTESIIDELWSDAPPRSAVTTTQTYIYHLRKLLACAVGEKQAGDIIITRPPGYVLQVPEEQIDARNFEHLADRGRALLSKGHDEEASLLLSQALVLWRGPALVGVGKGPNLSAYAVHLEELRIQIQELRIQIEQRLGRHREVIPELRWLVTNYPLNESFHAQLITSLRFAGRRGEALMAYQSLCRILRDELDIEPSPPLRSLQRELLRDL